MAYARQKNTAPKEAASAATALTAEQRREQRFPADGTVCLILDRDGAEVINGRLADVSSSGFRAVHRCQELSPGRVIRFHFDDLQSGTHRSGWARVIWSRVLDAMVESGCFIVIAD